MLHLLQANLALKTMRKTEDWDHDDRGGVFKQTQRGNCCSDQYNYCPLCFIIYFASHCSPRDFHLLSNSQQQLIYGLAVSLSEVRRGLGLMTRDQLMFSCYHGKLSFHLVVNHHSALVPGCAEPSAGNVLSLLNISSAVLSLSPISAERNTNHSDLSKVHSLRIITVIALISTRCESCHRSELADSSGDVFVFL